MARRHQGYSSRSGRDEGNLGTLKAVCIVVIIITRWANYFKQFDVLVEVGSYNHRTCRLCGGTRLGRKSRATNRERVFHPM